jgi:hypothetical protein
VASKDIDVVVPQVRAMYLGVKKLGRGWGWFLLLSQGVGSFIISVWAAPSSGDRVIVFVVYMQWVHRGVINSHRHSLRQRPETCTVQNGSM